MIFYESSNSFRIFNSLVAIIPTLLKMWLLYVSFAREWITIILTAICLFMAHVAHLKISILTHVFIVFYRINLSSIWCSWFVLQTNKQNLGICMYFICLSEFLVRFKLKLLNKQYFLLFYKIFTIICFLIIMVLSIIIKIIIYSIVIIIIMIIIMIIMMIVMYCNWTVKLQNSPTNRLLYQMFT